MRGGLREALRRCALALGLALPLLSPGPAEASQRTCRQLEAQIASVGGTAGTAQARRYDSAIRAQEDQIARARGQSRSAGCGGFFSALRGQCSAIQDSIGRMERNLAELRNTRARLTGAGTAAAERRRIEAALNAANCRGATPTQRTARGAPPADAAPARRAASRPSGNLRTICVRSCDGYFFPVAWSSSRADFDRDAKACAAMCPGAEVDLHYHRVPGQESDEMISAATGRPYTEMPNAFLYRDASYARSESCTCDRARNFTVIAGSYGAGGAERDAAGSLPPPVTDGDPAADPETRANLDGGLDAAALAALFRRHEQDITASVTPEPAGERRVRVVGPAFLPDPEAAIDLRAQDPRQAR